MGYDFLPLPQQNLGIAFEGGDSIDAEIERIEQIKNYGSKEFDYIDLMKSFSLEMKRMREGFDAVRINTDTLTSKFPIAAADQNLQRSWNAFSFNANWTNANAATNPTQSRKTSEGIVYVQGFVKNTAGFAYGGVNSAIGTLASGNRPVSQMQRAMLQLYDAGYANYMMGIVDITTAGVCSINGAVPIPAGGGTGAANSSIAFYFSFLAI